MFKVSRKKDKIFFLKQKKKYSISELVQVPEQDRIKYDSIILFISIYIIILNICGFLEVLELLKKKIQQKRNITEMRKFIIEI